MNRITVSQGKRAADGVVRIDSATPPTLTARNTTVTGGTIVKAGATIARDADAYSAEAYTGSAYATASFGQTNKAAMFALN